VVELALEGLLRASGIEPPRLHDVSLLLLAERERLPAPLRPRLARWAAISGNLDRDRSRENAGSEVVNESSEPHRPVN
jgi:HEPN domain-containing protein